MPSITLKADRDARIYSPDRGAGTSDYVPVGLWDGHPYRTLLHFPSPNWTGLGIRRVTSAVLHLRTSHQTYVGRGGSPRLFVKRLTQNWSEGSALTLSSNNAVTWANQPAATANGQKDSGTLPDTNDVWVAIDITAIVRAWAPTSVESGGGTGNYGVRLESFDEGSTSRTDEFYSRETSSDPYLVVTYESNTAPGAPTITAPVADADGNPALATWHEKTTGDRTRYLSFAFARNDADAGDYITAYQLQIFPDGATDATPGTALFDSHAVAVSAGPTSLSVSHNVAGVLGAGGTYRARVKTADKAGVWGAWSSLTKSRFRPGAGPSVANMAVDPNTTTPNFYASIKSLDGRAIGAVRVRVYQDTTQGAVLKWDSDWVDAGGTRFTLPYGGSQLDFGTTYRWNAQIRDDLGFESGQTTYLSWKPTEVTGPDNMTPRSVNAKQNTLTPTLTVGNSQSFDADEIEAAKFADPLSADEYLWQPGQSTFTSTTARGHVYAGETLDWGRTYYWRARVRVGGVTWSPWSPWYPFYVNALPTAPTVSVDNAVDSGLGYVAVTSTTPTIRAPFADPDLTRDTSEHPTKEEIWIQQEVTGTRPSGYGPKILTTGITDTHKVAVALTAEATYAVQVRFADSAGQYGPLSDTVRFKVTTAPTLSYGAAPNAADPTPTLAWTFASTAGKAQRAYRVTVKLASDGTLVYDSGLVESAVSSHVVPAGYLEDATTYTWDVVAYDTDGLPTTVTATRAAVGQARTSAVTGTAATGVKVLTQPGTPAYYIAPTGNDTTGDGSQANPWRTLGKLYSKLKAGDTALVRGGTYVGADITQATVSSVGTPTAPITVRAYPGETPIFDGSASGTYVWAIQWVPPAAYHVLDGISFRNFTPTQGAILVVGDSTAVGPATANHITVQRCHLIAKAGLTQTEHGIYLTSWHNAVTIQDNELEGTGNGPSGDEGAAVEVYHTPGGDDNVVQRNLIHGWRQGVQIWESTVDRMLVLHNTFWNNYAHVDARFAGTGCVVRDNLGDAASDTDFDNTAGVTADHNYWDKSLTDGHLHTGDAALGGASDGSDPGVYQSSTVARSGTAAVSAATGTAATGTGGTPTTYVAAVNADSPAVYFRLGEASGALVDSVTGLASSSQSGITYGVTGGITGDSNKAIQGAGAGSVVIPANAAHELGDVFTIEFLVKRSVLGSVQVVLDKGSWGQVPNVPVVWFEADNKIYLGRSKDFVKVIGSAVAIADTTSWHHVAFTKNGATVHCYVDGALSDAAGTATTFANSGQAMHLLEESDGSWKASLALDEVALYKSALSAARVSAHNGAR